MFNYSNLNDVEFEELCKDIMQKKINTKLRSFARGKDGGVDLCDNIVSKKVVVQVKHYLQSTQAQLVASLKQEIPKVKRISPEKYYVCCSRELSSDRIAEIFNMFSDYMESPDNVITLKEIDDFLREEDNKDILERHYKLWIESSGILQNIINNDIFIDCESLFATAEQDQKRFVQTQVYYDARKMLTNNQTIMIIGNPGVGKTITSEMLVLYFASKGYRVRYTTSTSDLQELKKSLARSAETKEIILIDDCFGQAYFDMKHSQNKELLAIVKYVRAASNKLLVLNSRVTIYREACRKGHDLNKSLEYGEYNVCVLDMNEMPDIDKARILYNHLYSEDIPEEYFNEIRKEERYFSIIKHANFNPRIIEYISRPSIKNRVTTEEYYTFIVKCMNNPQEVWRDEYENNLEKADRVLLSTIYSFSDEGGDYEHIKKAFGKRVSGESAIDTTTNVFNASIERLTEGFIHIADKSGKRRLMMANPSLNDFFDQYILENDSERTSIIQNALYIEQYTRMMSETEFNRFFIQAIKTHDFKDILLTNAFTLNAMVVLFIGRHSIKDHCYDKIIIEYLMMPDAAYINDSEYYSEEEILVSLLNNEEVVDFYNIRKVFDISYTLDEISDKTSPDELIRIINKLSNGFGKIDRQKYIDAAIDAIEICLEGYCDYIEASDYDPDVTQIIEDETRDCEEGSTFDKYNAIEEIECEVTCAVMAEIDLMLNDLPGDIVIPKEFIDGLHVSVFGADQLIESYIYSGDYENHFRRELTNTDNEIKLMFER